MAGEIETLDLIGDLPPSWKVARFGDVLEGGTRNGIYKSKEFHGRGAKVVNMGELFANPRLRDVPMKRVELSDSEMEKSCLKQGDLLFARRSLVAEGAGKCIVVAEIKEPTTFESSIIRARPNPQVADSLFLYYLFNSPYGAYVLLTIRRQVAVSGITGTDLVELPLPLPPLAEQKTIAAVLGALDDKIELNRRMNATLEAMARALFKSWFVDFDPVRARLDGRPPAALDPATAALFPAAFKSSQSGPIPAGWGHTTLAEFCSKITDGAHQSPKSVDAGFPMASVKDMTDWEINIPGCRHISEVDYRGLLANGCQPEVGDILLAKDGATCLDTACEYHQKEQIVLLSSVAILRPKHSSDSAFLHTWLGLSSTKTYLKENFVSGSAIPRVVLRDMKRAQLICPPRSILDAFARAAAPLREQIRHNHDQSRTLATLRDTLLPKLLSGELSVNH